MKKELIWAYALAIGMKMKVKELIRLLQKYDVELYCYSMDCANVELIVEPSGDLLMDEWGQI